MQERIEKGRKQIKQWYPDWTSENTGELLHKIRQNGVERSERMEREYKKMLRISNFTIALAIVAFPSELMFIILKIIGVI